MFLRVVPVFFLLLLSCVSNGKSDENRFPGDEEFLSYKFSSRQVGSADLRVKWLLHRAEFESNKAKFKIDLKKRNRLIHKYDVQFSQLNPNRNLVVMGLKKDGRLNLVTGKWEGAVFDGYTGKFQLEGDWMTIIVNGVTQKLKVRDFPKKMVVVDNCYMPNSGSVADRIEASDRSLSSVSGSTDELIPEGTILFRTYGLHHKVWSAKLCNKGSIIN